ncbi:MAG: hypothetical protein GX878_04575 [Firmicutes bacterium]|nr:hypothetical protein [Bacillota bacterium]
MIVIFNNPASSNPEFYEKDPGMTAKTDPFNLKPAHPQAMFSRVQG